MHYCERSLKLNSIQYIFLLWYHYFSEARDHFDIYDFEGEGKIDAKDLGDLLRSLDCKPTLATVKKNGGSDKKGMY